MKAAGFDLSTKAIDVVTIPFDDVIEHEGERAIHTRVPLELDKSDPTAAHLYVCRILRASVWDKFDFEDVVVAFVESPVGPGSRRLLPVFGALIAALPRDVAFCPLAPSEWKREFTGSGRSTKDDVSDTARAMGCPAEWSQDACDAFGIAWAGREMNLRALGVVAA
jgi:hypothetical protein